MTDQDRSPRLDELLIRAGLVTPEQVSAALQRQKLYGGRIGTQLLQMGVIDEATLVRVLAEKLGCEGIILGGLDITDAVIQMIPATVAIARKVIPFVYDAGRDLLKVACEDPGLPDILGDLKFASGGKNIQLYVASELALNHAIAKYYLGRELNLPVDTKPGLPAMTLPEGVDTTSAPNGRSDAIPRGAILLVTDDTEAGDQLYNILERDGFKVVRTDSADDAIQIIGSRKFHSVFIQDTVPGDYIDLIDRLRKLSPKTRVRYFESVSSLLLSLDAGVLESELVARNLELFTSLLSSDSHSRNHSTRVGQYADRLCRRLELADKDRLIIINAAYLHDLSKYYYGDAQPGSDHRTPITLTIKLLESLNYSPLVVEVLRSAYINLREKFTKRLPIEVLGGNILTVTDIFCDMVDLDSHLTLDRFDTMKRKYRDLVGKLFLTEVVEAFIAMIQEELLSISALEKFSQVLLYGTDPLQLTETDQRIKAAGFRTVAEQSLDVFIDLCKRSNPDIIVLHECSGVGVAKQLVESLIQHGVAVDKIPTYLLTDGALATQMSLLLEKGIEDIIPADDNLNILLIKMKKIQSRIEEKARGRGELVQQQGAAGNLDDMSLIDLLQALGPSRKTVKLTVTSEKQKLTLYLDQGTIVHADAGGLSGPEAVYAALAWTRGNWKTQTVTSESIPEPNTFSSNESILMEGCRRLDELSRAQA